MLSVIEYTDQGQQSAHLLILQEIEGHKLETVVRVDSSHPNQSSAAISVWDENRLQWNRVASLVGHQIPCENYLKKQDAAERAAETLLHRAVAILELV